MRALYSLSGTVPASRILREHRAVLVPLGIVLAANLVALIAVVLPLSQRAAGTEQRAIAAERRLTTAETEFSRAEGLRAAKARAFEDLDTFYRNVLPVNVGAARRMLQLRLRQQAEKHGITYFGGGSTEEELRQSSLLRLTMSMRLAGSYDDIRGFIHDIETSPDFIVIDQVRLSEAQRGGTGLELAMDVSTFYRAPGAVIQAASDGR
jgi:Tfp pilus assembly protein PilO